MEELPWQDHPHSGSRYSTSSSLASPVVEGQPVVPVCRFFASKNGCRSGEKCPFLHDAARLGVLVEPAASQGDGPSLPESSVERGTGRRQAVTAPVSASRVVSKPVPQAQIQNPREFQLGQLRRRFSPKETRDGHGGTNLDFSMAPSDPDFPFEMQALQCVLTVPKSYPGIGDASRPRLRVKNQEFAKGFAINIEKGFESLVEGGPDATLLGIMSALDKNLESFLSKKQAETVKLVANADTRHLATLPTRALGEKVKPVETPKNVSSSSKITSKPEIVFTNAEKAAAKERRDAETRQLEVRLGRLPFYKKSPDGIAYTLPVEPRRRSELPLPLQGVKTVQLFVPVLYPLQSCRIQLDGSNPEDSLSTELAFQQRATEMKELNLMVHVNYLAQNMHVLAKTVPMPKSKPASEVGDKEEAKVVPEAVKSSPKQGDGDRSHIKIIPRPPEWDIDSSDASESDDDNYLSWDSNEESDNGANINTVTTKGPDKNPEKGTALSFPSLELYNIELLELTSLNLTIKCIRCKLPTDLTGLKHGVPKTSSCTKCGTVLTVTFRHDLMHVNAVRAGFLDLEGCTVVDMLPSAFIPTCSTCSEEYPAPGIIAVRGDVTTAVCRTCHAKLTLKIAETRFLRITSSSAPAPTSGPKRKAVLGVTAGTELPDRGGCKHYRKSYRWFRFSCCEKVYPCDKCHDEGEEHGYEHGNRMICGWCSREQNYRPEDCAFCGRHVIGRKGTGFWEGGKGTRDKVRMSRKDPRKHKRIGTSAKKE